MKKYVRGTILAGQIISLVIFAFFSFAFFTLSGAYADQYEPLFRTFAIFLGCVSFLEVPMAIIGIIQSTRPFRKFSIGMAIVSSVFDTLLAIFLFAPLVFSNGVQGVIGTAVTVIIILLGAVALLIGGTIKASKEKKQPLPFVFDPNGKNPETPPSETPAVDIELPPLTGKTADDLAKLKKLYEYKLIGEEEYTQKKKEILARDFSGK